MEPSKSESEDPGEGMDLCPSQMFIDLFFGDYCQKGSAMLSPKFVKGTFEGLCRRVSEESGNLTGIRFQLEDSMRGQRTRTPCFQSFIT